MSKILVTGANGFIGRALTARLSAIGREVVALSQSDGDIAEKQTFAQIKHKKISHVFHLAGQTYVPDSWNNPLEFYRVNIMGVLNVLEFCRLQGTPMTYVSAYVYGHPEALPIREDSMIRPSNPYALSKWLAEESCEFYASVYGLSVTTLRPFNVYGIGQNRKFLIPTIIDQVLDADTIIVRDLAPRRDYVYLEDLVSALLKTLGQQGDYKAYNIGAGVSFSVQEIIDIIQDIAGTKKNVVCDHTVRANELMDVVADISRADKALGWQPQYTFRDGLESIIRSERERRR